MKPEHVALMGLAGAIASVGKHKAIAVLEHNAKKTAKPNAQKQPVQKPTDAPVSVETVVNPNGMSNWMPDFSTMQ